METLITEIFDFLLKCFIYVTVVGGFICFLALVGKFIDYSTVEGGHTFLTDRENRQ